MKKILLSTCIFCMAAMATAQTCPQIQGFTPVPVTFGINIYGFPESVIPIIPLYWNRFYKVDEVTGQLVPTGCVYTGDPNIQQYAACACFLTGSYFRRVTDVCDPTPCGGDVSLPQLPITNNNNPASSWSAAATWVANQVPDMASSLSVMVTKTTQLDADLNITKDHWLIFSAGNSSVLPGITVTNNSVIQIYPAAQLENFGTLNGSGQIFGSLLNSAVLSPGNSPGKFTIVGNYTAGSTAVHQIEIAATDLYDTISITRDSSFPGGNAVLNGTLNINLINGFIPSLGDTYKIITFTAATGVFSGINLPALPTGLSWGIDYNAKDVTLEVKAASLPLTIKYTRAYRQNSGVQVDWGTESESNVKNYEVERSTDGVYFSKAGTVNANAGTINSYGWFDASPVKGNNYYRIKAVDIDGKFIYSAILLVRMTGNNSLTVYPNPVKRGETLQLSMQNNTATRIEILNTAGQVLYSKTGQLTASMGIPVSAAWPAGQYLLRVISENKVETQKILLW
jgi:Secretion system C-terminal sorting domain